MCLSHPSSQFILFASKYRRARCMLIVAFLAGSLAGCRHQETVRADHRANRGRGSECRRARRSHRQGMDRHAGRPGERRDPRPGHRISVAAGLSGRRRLSARASFMFEIDRRPFEAALNQARGNLAQAESSVQQALGNLAQSKAQARKGRTRREALYAAGEDEGHQPGGDGQRAFRANWRPRPQWNPHRLRSRRRKRPWPGGKARRVRRRSEAGLHQDHVARGRNCRDRENPGRRSRVAVGMALTTVSTVDPIKAYFSVSEQEYWRSIAPPRAAARLSGRRTWNWCWRMAAVYAHKGRSL